MSTSWPTRSRTASTGLGAIGREHGKIHHGLKFATSERVSQRRCSAIRPQALNTPSKRVRPMATVQDADALACRNQSLHRVIFQKSVAPPRQR
jgi:hypothetical protein